MEQPLDTRYFLCLLFLPAFTPFDRALNGFCDVLEYWHLLPPGEVRYVHPGPVVVLDGVLRQLKFQSSSIMTELQITAVNHNEVNTHRFIADDAPLHGQTLDAQHHLPAVSYVVCRQDHAGHRPRLIRDHKQQHPAPVHHCLPLQYVRVGRRHVVVTEPVASVVPRGAGAFPDGRIVVDQAVLLDQGDGDVPPPRHLRGQGTSEEDVHRVHGVVVRDGRRGFDEAGYVRAVKGAGVVVGRALALERLRRPDCNRKLHVD